jgi:hypothetical protein
MSTAAVTPFVALTLKVMLWNKEVDGFEHPDEMKTASAKSEMDESRIRTIPSPHRSSLASTGLDVKTPRTANMEPLAVLFPGPDRSWHRFSHEGVDLFKEIVGLRELLRP